MAEENTSQNQDSQIGDDGQGTKDPTRSESRQQDLANKLAEQEKRHALELEERDKKLKEAESIAKNAVFEADFTKESQKYPNAEKRKDEIKSYLDKGLSVSEATLVVLGKNNELVTGEQQHREGLDSSSMGGSSANASPTGIKNPDNMTQEERLIELRKLEESGNLGVSEKGLFLK
jgi:hypothetical protein